MFYFPAKSKTKITWKKIHDLESNVKSSLLSGARSCYAAHYFINLCFEIVEQVLKVWCRNQRRLYLTWENGLDFTGESEAFLFCLFWAATVTFSGPLEGKFKKGGAGEKKKGHQQPAVNKYQPQCEDWGTRNQNSASIDY